MVPVRGGDKKINGQTNDIVFQTPTPLVAYHRYLDSAQNRAQTSLKNNNIIIAKHGFLGTLGVHVGYPRGANRVGPKQFQNMVYIPQSEGNNTDLNHVHL